MADIIIRLVKTCADQTFEFPRGTTICEPVMTYRSNNFESLNWNLNTPVQIIALPQAEGGDEDAFTIKVEGNITTINVSWTIIDEAATVVDEFTGMGGQPAVVQTAAEQICFLTGAFQNKTIEYCYDFYLGEEGACCDANNCISPPLTRAQACTAFGASSMLKKRVKVQGVTFTKSKQTPVTYIANMTMAIGQAKLTTNEDMCPSSNTG